MELNPNFTYVNQETAIVCFKLLEQIYFFFAIKLL
jgi:hypothetical protein